MDKVNQILHHKTYRQCLAYIKEFETKRIFCGHDMTHFMNVARLAYLFDLEENLEIPKDIVYGAALLHDVGRHIQYQIGIPHQEAGIPIAEEILRDCGYKKKEIELILDAILNHRNPEIEKEKSIRGILYRGDKMSRSCYSCEVEKECKWSREKKNLRIEY